ncbi:outer membrane protein assembly factor BamE [Mangrovicoccus algicola]|nr:outer membrane protein assembly factor BamE [Mangrovicoccus algicola]
MRGAGLAVAMSGLVSCTTMYDDYGYVPTDMQLAEIEPGSDTRESVEEKVGAPPLDDFRRDDVWYFVASRNATYAWRKPETIERQVVAIRFTEGGSVSNIERYGLENGEVVTLSRRVTESAVPDLGFLRGLLNSTSLAPALPSSESL